jgi:CcmD family protein
MNGYVAAAYIVFVVLIGLYVAIMGAKLGRLQRSLERLEDRRDPER